MCGIAGIVSLDGSAVPQLEERLGVMAGRIAHRGPDGEGRWIDPSGIAGFVHRRLAIIDLSDTGAQPMAGADGCQLVHNGEIYNYPELRAELSGGCP
jgi:asparagine synthase (glutamine-hydrolysing)